MKDLENSMALFAEMNPEPILRTDKTGKILLANTTMKELLENKEIKGKQIQNLIPSSESIDFAGIIKEERIEKHQFVLNNQFYSFTLKGIAEHEFCHLYGTDITDKVTLQKKADSIALFAKMNPAPVFRFNLLGEITESNKKAEELFTEFCEYDEVNIFKLFPELEKGKIQNLIYNEEIDSFVQNFSDKVYRFELKGIRDLLSVQGYGADITEIVKAQYENEKLSKAIQQSSNSVMVTDIDGNIEFVNDAFEEISGYTKDEVIGRNPRFLKTNYHSKETYKKLWETISSGKVWKGEFYNRKKDGINYWEEASITPILDSEGTIRNYISVKEDITEKKRAREQAHSMALFAQLNPEPVLRFDKRGIVLQANPVANETLGRKNIEGMQVKELFDELKGINISQFIDNNQIETIDVQKQNKVFRFIIKGIKDIAICQIYGSDITKRIEAQKNAESMALFAQLNPEPVFRFDENGKILQSNPAANVLFEKDQMNGNYVSELLPGIADLEIKKFIKNNKLLTITENVGDRILRVMVRGISKLNVCQIYASDITERVKAERKVRQQKEDIDDSIQYASRIQNAVMPNVNLIEKYAQDHFILLKPRDVVSGDFYWMTERQNKLVLVAADCTGHGVPGAFMSMLGISFLNHIVNSDMTLKASKILDKLRDYVKSTLAQSGEKKDDGMDLSLIILDRENMKMEFAGAYNHLYLFRKGEMTTLKADRMPIGNFIKDNVPFTNHETDIEENDVIYMLSDGYPDQFNTSMRKKYTIKKLKNDFSNIHHLSMNKQKEILDQNFEAYREDHWQMDDVLVMGLRV